MNLIHSVVFASLMGMASTAAGGLIGFTQSTSVKGRLICNDEPAKDVAVKLFDEDRGLDGDDFIAGGKTNANGEFTLSGYAKEISTIDPKLNIYHDCNDGIKPCQRKFSIRIPDRYVSKGKQSKMTFDAGTIQLAGKFPGEDRDCIH